jgi:hypothetical protein
MADKKMTDLTDLSTAIASVDVVHVVQEMACLTYFNNTMEKFTGNSRIMNCEVLCILGPITLARKTSQTILETEEYKNGDLSTNFLKRFGIIDRLKEDLKNQRKDKQIAAIAAAVMHSTFFQSRVKSSNITNPRWKSRMDR